MRKELLEKFINDNFDLTFFNIVWSEDFLVSLKDSKSIVSFISYDGVTIDCYIDGEYFNSYRHDKDLLNKDAWFVINKRRKESEYHE